MIQSLCGAFVMVIDDDDDLRETIMEVLQDNAHRVVGACNGQEALDLLHGAKRLPCVILLDLMMPVMNGRQFRVALMNDPELSDIPVVILSAHANIDEVLDDLSVDAKLSKPVEIAPLLALVNQHCSEAEAKEQALTL